MTTIIERAARAVAEKLNADAMAMPGKRATDADVVRAVLQAIREPSEGMVEAAEDTREPWESGGYYSEDLPSPDIVWKAMIDAALEDKATIDISLTKEAADRLNEPDAA